MIDRSKSRYSLLCITLVTILVVPLMVLADPPLTDPEKLQKVYSMYIQYKEEFPAVRDISGVEARRMLAGGQKVLFVDVRRPEEREVSMLPSSISKKEFLQSEAGTYDDFLVVGYCTISYRSGIFAKELTASGQPIYNLRGGMLAWVHEGGQIFSDSMEVRRIHVYGNTWSLAPEGFETVAFPLWKQLLPF